jgi:hypothetical protein
VDGNNFVSKKGLAQIPDNELNLEWVITQNPGIENNREFKCKTRQFFNHCQVFLLSKTRPAVYAVDIVKPSFFILPDTIGSDSGLPDPYLTSHHFQP